MRYIQRCKQGNQIYTKSQTKATSDIQRCKQRQLVIYKDVNKCYEWYTKM